MTCAAAPITARWIDGPRSSPAPGIRFGPATRFAGSFLWEWQDRAVADKCKTKLYDFDPATGVSYLKNKGLVDGWRNPRPDYYAVKMEYSPILVGRDVDMSSKSGIALLDITNRYSFMDLSYVNTKWRLLRGGRIHRRRHRAPAIGPAEHWQGGASAPVVRPRANLPTRCASSSTTRAAGISSPVQFELVKPKPLSIKGTPLPEGLLFPRVESGKRSKAV